MIGPESPIDDSFALFGANLKAFFALPFRADGKKTNLVTKFIPGRWVAPYRVWRWSFQTRKVVLCPRRMFYCLIGPARRLITARSPPPLSVYGLTSFNRIVCCSARLGYHPSPSCPRQGRFQKRGTSSGRSP